jgi:hypothetical protein
MMSMRYTRWQGIIPKKRDPEATLEELTGKLTAVLGAEV